MSQVIYGMSEVVSKQQATMATTKNIIKALEAAKATAKKFDSKVMNKRFLDACSSAVDGVHFSWGEHYTYMQVYCSAGRSVESDSQHWVYTDHDRSYIRKRYSDSTCRNYVAVEDESNRLNAEELCAILDITIQSEKETQAEARKIIRYHESMHKKFLIAEKKIKDIREKYAEAAPYQFRKVFDLK